METLVAALQQSPITGDSFSPVVIGIIAGVAVIGLIVSTVLSKKNK